MYKQLASLPACWRGGDVPGCWMGGDVPGCWKKTPETRQMKGGSTRQCRKYTHRGGVVRGTDHVVSDIREHANTHRIELSTEHVSRGQALCSVTYLVRSFCAVLLLDAERSRLARNTEGTKMPALFWNPPLARSLSEFGAKCSPRRKETQFQRYYYCLQTTTKNLIVFFFAGGGIAGGWSPSAASYLCLSAGVLRPGISKCIPRFMSEGSADAIMQA